MPPNSQGATAPMALGIAAAALGEDDGKFIGDEDPARHHLLIEAVRLALEDRDAHLTDPDWMDVDVADLLAPARLAERAARIDPRRAAAPGGPPGVAGDTAYLCTADRHGMVVSLIQSNYAGFGSGLRVPGWGINLHNRGAYFSLRPGHVNAIAPRKRTLHTLMPALALRDEQLWLAFGTMGADAQASVQVQVLTRRLDGEPLDAAIAAPRWTPSPGGPVIAESRLPDAVLEGLRARGHQLMIGGEWDHGLGHAHAIEARADRGWSAAADPRSEGAALGV
jgi:gamma-glutamyltranspeptidase/glutathione hydrolase